MTCNWLLILCSDEVAVIDEIQMIRDPARGWAWTRALLGEYSVVQYLNAAGVNWWLRFLNFQRKGLLMTLLKAVELAASQLGDTRMMLLWFSVDPN